ncbi:extracellular solute-binding protein [Ilumatobacter coccineus]|uniref:Putative ABC transporter substrate-binding protein n=1 Tax=Ilumatobacter coccineus (strain NBRC 103263 / KCTC 29153 / YM16-304) TaxID=1313172 RepID=A0A6C7EGS0_ILUCY|nr:extracellular solute-binding protein [Ilumatobacter coccineus]BAN03798.1 putative ABC transporter substrate-binding protein [Ilumatobacter coccineus YM16-304]
MTPRRAHRSLAATACAALLFAACGSDDDSADTAGADEVTEADESTDAGASDGDSSEAAASGDEIDVWIAFTDDRLDWTEAVAAEFNAQNDGPDVVVQGYEDYESLFDATLLAFDQGEPPAVVQYFEAATTEARDAVGANGGSLFTSVEAAIDGRTEINGVPVVLDDVVTSAANYYTIDGTFSSMPWNTSSATMFLNRSLLDAAGVDGTPETWDDLRSMCEAFMASAVATDSCISWPNHSWFLEQSVAQQGALLANNDNGRADRATEVLLDSEAMVDYVSFWKGMQDDGLYVYTGTQRDWGGTYDLFAAQEIPFLVYSSSDTTLLTDEGVNGGFDVESAFMPRNGDATAGGGNIIGGATLWLVDGLPTADQDTALAFMNFLNNPENAADWHRTTGYIPITNASVELLESEGWFDENPNSAVANNQLKGAETSAATAGALLGNFVAIRDVLTEGVEDILVNDLDPAERLAEAQEDAQQLLDEYNELFG